MKEARQRTFGKAPEEKLSIGAAKALALQGSSHSFATDLVCDFVLDTSPQTPLILELVRFSEHKWL